jgi:hypothetical protein
MSASVKYTLDLRYGAELPVELSKQIVGLGIDVDREYTDYVGRLSQDNVLSELDWLINVTSRDPYHTKLFDNFYKLKILDYCLGNDIGINAVTVDNDGMHKAISEMCNRHNLRCNIQIKKAWKKNEVFRALYNIMSAIYISIISFVVPRLLSGKKAHPDKPIVYVDTFVKASDFDEEGGFIDRHYDGMAKNMSSEYQADICYVPVLYAIKTPMDVKWIIEKSRKSSIRFLIMEEWLRIYDYLYAFIASCFLHTSIKKIPHWLGVDVSSIVKKELYKDICSPALFRSILVYRFILRMRKSGVLIRQVVDWNENQIVDRSLNLAIRKYYPGVKIVGYQGFIVSEYYVSHSPADYEVTAGTIPDYIGVISPKLIGRKRKFSPEQKVVLAPAFRMKELLSYDRHKKEENHVVLLALPTHVNVCERIINACLGLGLDDYSNLKFIIKQHPTITKEMLCSSIPQASNPKFEFTEESLYSFFPSTKLLISSDSSVCFEAISCGVHVVIMGSLSGVSSNPVLGIFDNSYWDICYDSECLKNILDNERDVMEVNVDEILTPVTKETVEIFLECTT